MRIIRTGVYRIVNNIDGKFYIGSSKDITGRWNNHTKDLRKNKHHSPKLQNAWNKHGAENFTLEILEECVCVKEVILGLEQFYLDAHRPHYNVSPTAHSTLGMKQSDQAKKNMSEAAKKRKRGPCSEETKAKISEANKGKKRTPEMIQRMVENRAPYTASDETRAKLSRAFTGRTFTPEWRERLSIAAKRRKK